MRLPHFLRKFAMTEGNEEKQKEIQKIDSRFRGCVTIASFAYN